MDETSVVIAGGGPVGMTTALVLAMKGVEVVVLEAGDDLQIDSRASTVHASTLELLDELGVAWDVILAGLIIPVVQYRDRKYGLIAEFHMDVMSDYTKFPIRQQTDQSLITRILAKKVATLDVATIKFGHRVTGMENRDGYVVTTSETADGPVQIRSEYGIGCDGSHSAVRKSVDIDFPGDRYGHRLLKVLTPYDVLSVMPELATVTYILDDQEAFGVICLPDHTRVTFQIHGDETEEELMEPEAVQQRLRRALPEPPSGEFPIGNVLMYSIHKRLADRFRVGNVFLAGDAAHVNHGAGGMGMNSGIHDGYALGKALATVMQGDAGDEILDGYAASRRSVAAGYIHSRSHRNAREREAGGQAERETRDKRLQRAASTPALMRDFLLQASMFDSAPRVLWS
jgi:3-(3-hydroxy-phenyl)propionate hydroxylase